MTKLYVYKSMLDYAKVSYEEIRFSLLPPAKAANPELICLGTIDITPLAEEDKGV